MKLRKIVSCLLCLILLCSLVACSKPTGSEIVFDKLNQTIYYKTLDDQSTVEVYFRDGNNQIPYITLETWSSMANKIYNEGIGDYPKDESYKLSVSNNGETATLTRENGSSMVVDFKNQTIYFSDYDRFVAHSYDVSPLELPHMKGYDSDGNPTYIQRVVSEYTWTNGNPLTISLEKYHINVYHQDGIYYIPLQTLSDLLINMQYCNIMYNPNAIFVIDYETTAAEISTGEGLLAKYYETGAGLDRNKELIDFTYNELCLLMDYTYGNKEAHNIEDFDTYFKNTCNGEGKSIKELLTSEDDFDFEVGMSFLTQCALNDLHSSYQTATSYAGNVGAQAVAKTGEGTGYAQIISILTDMYKAQYAVYPNGCPAYEEIGNTAFIYFYNFLKTEDDHYNTANVADIEDTIELMLYAYSQVYREGSPVENVVLDLSTNLGGYEDALAFVCGMFTGKFTCSIVNPITGASSNAVYRIDANLDHKFDKYDWFFDKNLYCITSGTSFSCGNICPSILEQDAGITFLGSKTGGGNCIVAPFTTASGGWYAISSAKVAVYNHLNSYYGIDNGIDVDYRFDEYSDYYNRPAIVDFINNILQ